MDIIKERKSVRTFNGILLSNEDKEKLLDAISDSGNPYGLSIEYSFLEPEKYALKSPVLNGETLYLAPNL